MICPRCGSENSSEASGCSVCRAPLGPTTVTGVLTPLPTAAAEDAPTGFQPSALNPDLDDPQTSFVPPVSSSGDGDDAHTSFVPPPAAASDDGLTRPPAPRTPPPRERTGAARAEPPAAPSGKGVLQPGEALGTRYHIIRVLGVGGMGAVYQAWDAELGVAVALKVIRPEIIEDPTAAAEVERRFKRELLLARQVTHKNVVRIHDLGDIDGVKYITMTYVDGEDLATVLKREGRLPVPTVMRVARDVVAGLVVAHKAGIVHRDLKPANIMMDREGDALIMDFGIARSADRPEAAAPASLHLPAGVRATSVAEATRYGTVVGTVEYMAPEQARGEQVDQRADIYALGLMLYDMLVGREHRAQHTNSAIAELRARMELAPPPPRTVVPEIPAALDQLVARCLEPDPAKRYQTTEDLAAALGRLDDHGVPIPLPRRFTPRLIAAAVVVVAALVTGTWWLTRTPPPAKKHDPVNVLIADFDNKTGDTEFDHTLEPMFKLALEGAGFITAYDRTKIRSSLGVRPPEKLDEVTARELAVKQGVGVVLAGAIDPQTRGYRISVKAIQPLTGKTITSLSGRASTKDEVLGEATQLVTSIRKALGDETKGSDQLLAMRSISTTSLAVASYYAAALEAQSKGKYEDALRNYSKTVTLDPKFGLGYQGMAVMSRNVGRLQDAEKYAAEALRYLDGMTERERFAARANYYLRKSDYQQCVKEYGELIARFPADSVAHNQRAICLARLRKMPEAVNEVAQAVQIVPKHVTYRSNLALFAAYAGDYERADKEVQAVTEPDAHLIYALALSQIGRGLFPEARDTYQRLGTMGRRGASFGSAGMADLAVYEGRFSDAVRMYEEGAAADLAAKSPDQAAMKFTAMANALLLAGQRTRAEAAAAKALQNSQVVPIRFLAGRVLAEAGAVAKARELAGNLEAALPAEPQAYGKIIEGDIALTSGDPRRAIKVLIEANGILDTWLGRFDLGRAYLAAGAFAEADSEFDRCIARRGEALSLLDEDPTYGYFPAAYYYQGRVRQGLQSAGFADSYREYLNIRGNSKEDPLVADARRRVEQ